MLLQTTQQNKEQGQQAATENTKQHQEVEAKKTVKEIKSELEGIKKELSNLQKEQGQEQTTTQTTEKLAQLQKSIELLDPKEKEKLLTEKTLLTILQRIPDPTKQKEILTLYEGAQRAKGSAERGKLVATVLDGFGLEAAIGAIEGIGDLGVGGLSSLYYVMEMARTGHASFWDYAKVLGIQTIDTTVGSVPVIGTIVDFFIKSNKFSAKTLEKIQKKVENNMLKMGITPEELTILMGKPSLIGETANIAEK